MSAQVDDVERADEAVGQNPARNIELGSRVDQIRSLGSEAGPLQRILESPEVEKLFALYDQEEYEARLWQKRYKRAVRLVLLLLVIAVVFGGLALLVPMPRDVAAVAYPTITVLVYLSLIVPLVLAWRLGSSRCYEKWNEHRGAGEYLRRRIFETVIDAPAVSQANELSPLALKLAYFRRYQLEVQENFHALRGSQNEARAWWARILIIPCLVLVLGWLVAVLAGAASAWGDQGALPEFVPEFAARTLSYLQWVEIGQVDTIGLMLGVATAVLYATLFVLTLLNTNLRNAARYAHARANFDYLRETALPAARSAAARGDEGTVRRFVDRVHSVMSTELADWVRLRELDTGKEQGAIGAIRSPA